MKSGRYQCCLECNPGKQERIGNECSMNEDANGLSVYKPGEFAKKLGVSTRTLQRWDSCGILKACRTPTNRRYYTQQQFEEYVAKGVR